MLFYVSTIYVSKYPKLLTYVNTFVGGLTLDLIKIMGSCSEVRHELKRPCFYNKGYLGETKPVGTKNPMVPRR